MENLEGGLIALEHRYEVGAIFRRIGHEYIYEGHRDPFDKKVWIHIFPIYWGTKVQVLFWKQVLMSLLLKRGIMLYCTGDLEAELKQIRRSISGTGNN